MNIPFKPFFITLLDVYDISETTKDAMAFPKKNFPNYDVVLMNVMNKNYLHIIHPDLVHDFYSVENLENYEKSELEVANTKRGLGVGLLFSEGKMWKMKRRILNAMFNFDFIKSLAPKISEISDRTLDSLDSQFEGEEV